MLFNLLILQNISYLVISVLFVLLLRSVCFV